VRRRASLRGVSYCRRTGYTLLELVVVIFILSLLAAVIFPSMSGLGEKSVTTEAKKTASLLRYLNDSAIYTKETYFLKFDLGEGLISWKGPDGEKAEKIKSLAGVRLPSKGEVKEGQVTVFFGPLGTREKVEISLKGKDEGLRVTLNPVSGKVRVVHDNEDER
jgi:general secretion pathway protein H